MLPVFYAGGGPQFSPSLQGGDVCFLVRGRTSKEPQQQLLRSFLRCRVRACFSNMFGNSGSRAGRGVLIVTTAARSCKRLKGGCFAPPQIHAQLSFPFSVEADDNPFWMGYGNLGVRATLRPRAKCMPGVDKSNQP